MKPEATDKPTELGIDVEQWRRDIQTFAQTTQQALEAIVSELSNQCSEGVPTNLNIGSKPAAIRRFENQYANPTGSVAKPAEPDGDERLDSLKARLAARISKSNPNN